MNPSPTRPVEADRRLLAVAEVIEVARTLTPPEIVDIARRHLHDHPPGPCPAAPLASCRRDVLDRIEAVVRTATGRAGAEREVRALRAEIEAALRVAAGPALLRAEPVLGAVSAAAQVATAAAVAALLPDRLSAETAALLSQTWTAARASAPRHDIRTGGAA